MDGRHSPQKRDVAIREVRVHPGQVTLEGTLSIPERAGGIVLFAHGSGSSRHSPRNRFVAGVIQDAGIATLLFDLLTSEEEAVDEMTRHLRFDIDMLADRLVGAAEWVASQEETRSLRLGFFGSSTGGGAALVAAARLGDRVGAVVSRGGRPDLAGPALARVTAPTLLVVGARDFGVIELNEEAFAELRCEKDLRLVPNATHLFEEPGALEEAARLAADWFARHLA
jgi:putative phosphoribosyl transferase